MAVQIDLTNEHAVEIGATYRVTFQLCNANDLNDGYLGSCQVKSSTNATEAVIEPTIEIVNKDTFSLIIPFSEFTASTQPGNYLYDVLFANSTDRFYAIYGKIALVQRITKMV